MGLFRAVYGAMELIYEEGLKEWLDESVIFEALEEINAELDNGEITEEEYEEKEVIILNRLKEIKDYKKEHDL